jgi:hypothetical protein
MKIKKPRVFLGDTGFDIVELQEQLMDDGLLPIMPYNPRNTDVPLDIKYRGDLIHQQTNKLSLNRKELDDTYIQQISVENVNNILLRTFMYADGTR